MSKDNIFALKKPESIISKVPWEEFKRVRPLLEGDKALLTGIPCVVSMRFRQLSR